MQLELSNFQRVAADEAIEQGVPDLGGAEQLLAPMIETSDHNLASLVRSVGMTSITNIDNLVSELQEAKLPAIRTGAHPSRASQLYGPLREPLPRR